MTQAQIWKNSPFSIERTEGKAPGTVIFRLCGPFSARDMYGSLTPIDLQDMLNFQSAPEPPVLNILDLTEVPTSIPPGWAWSSGIMSAARAKVSG